MSEFKIEKHHSKHFRDRIGKIEYIIIHCSIYEPLKNMKILDDLGLSAHYIIGRDGRIIENLCPSKVAYHAGVSSWNGSIDKSLNENSIGIELEAPNLGQDKKDFTIKQIKGLLWLLNMLVVSYNIDKQKILGHSDIAPSRKADPGCMFPWKKLANFGFGVWFDLRKLSRNRNEIELLKRIGYDVSNLSACRYAFCRHFFQDEVVVENDVFRLINSPYIEDFTPKDFNKYCKILRAVAFNFDKKDL